MIIFDGDLDKAIASFIIATGAAAMGNKVNMFFTFWGLSILRKENAPEVKKDFMSKMFSMMLPKSSKKLGLSKMNFFGMGSKMIRKVMKDKGVSSLEELISNAQKAGVKMTACQMSMDVMGLKKEELIDGVEVGGVAAMLEDNDNSNMNLFI
nr:DsrE/DsrF/DrsH-like family protein [Peptoniphilus ovalis]